MSHLDTSNTFLVSTTAALFLMGKGFEPLSVTVDPAICGATGAKRSHTAKIRPRRKLPKFLVCDPDRPQLRKIGRQCCPGCLSSWRRAGLVVQGRAGPRSQGVCPAAGNREDLHFINGVGISDESPEPAS